jgi:hypothetical protein
MPALKKRNSRIMLINYILNKIYHCGEMRNYFTIYLNDLLEDINDEIITSQSENKEENIEYSKKYLEELCKFYDENEEKITRMRILKQERQEGNIDDLIKSVINSAITELLYLQNQKLNKIIISEYLKISDSFKVNPKIINKILDTICKDLYQ